MLRDTFFLKSGENMTTPGQVMLSVNAATNNVGEYTAWIDIDSLE